MTGWNGRCFSELKRGCKTSSLPVALTIDWLRLRCAPPASPPSSSSSSTRSKRCYSNQCSNGTNQEEPLNAYLHTCATFLENSLLLLQTGHDLSLQFRSVSTNHSIDQDTTLSNESSVNQCEEIERLTYGVEEKARFTSSTVFLQSIDGICFSLEWEKNYSLMFSYGSVHHRSTVNCVSCRVLVCWEGEGMWNSRWQSTKEDRRAYFWSLGTSLPSLGKVHRMFDRHQRLEWETKHQCKGSVHNKCRWAWWRMNMNIKHNGVHVGVKNKRKSQLVDMNTLGNIIITRANFNICSPVSSLIRLKLPSTLLHAPAHCW